MMSAAANILQNLVDRPAVTHDPSLLRGSGMRQFRPGALRRLSAGTRSPLWGWHSWGSSGISLSGISAWWPQGSQTSYPGLETRRARGPRQNYRSPKGGCSLARASCSAHAEQRSQNLLRSRAGGMNSHCAWRPVEKLVQVTMEVFCAVGMIQRISHRTVMKSLHQTERCTTHFSFPKRHGSNCWTFYSTNVWNVFHTKEHISYL